MAAADVQIGLSFELPQFIDCGCCGSYHPLEFYGDCKDDANRFAADELDALYGPLGWEEVYDMEEDDEEDGEEDGEEDADAPCQNCGQPRSTHVTCTSCGLLHCDPNGIAATTYEPLEGGA